MFAQTGRSNFSFCPVSFVALFSYLTQFFFLRVCLFLITCVVQPGLKFPSPCLLLSCNMCFLLSCQCPASQL